MVLVDFGAAKFGKEWNSNVGGNYLTMSPEHMLGLRGFYKENYLFLGELWAIG